jgi:hypothetical protein
VSAAGASSLLSRISEGAPTVDTNAEERASELRARLIAERKRKVLREQLMARKKAKTEDKPDQPGKSDKADQPKSDKPAEANAGREADNQADK